MVPRRLYYWLPPASRSAPDTITLVIWRALQPIAREYDLAVHGFADARELRELVRVRGKPELVHFGTTPIINLMPRTRTLAAAIRMRLPLSTHVHGDLRAELRFAWDRAPRHAIKIAAAYTLSPLLLRLHELVVVNSQALADSLALGDRIRVMPNPIDVGFWSAPVAASAAGRYAFAHGRLVAEKGFDLLLEAVARNDTVERVVIAGTGPAQPELARLAERRHIDLELVGHQDPNQLRAWLAGATVAVYPSRQDVFGLAALEALLACRHVLISERAGVLEFLPPAIRRSVSIAPSVDVLAERLADPPSTLLGSAAAQFSSESVAREFASAAVAAMTRRRGRTADRA